MTGKVTATATGWLAAAMVIFLAALAGAPFLAGGLYVTQHEGDTLHLADLVLRMADAGQVPHLDFMTPIGIGALWPIALFERAGLGFGHAFLAAQAAVAVLMFLPILRAGQSRFPGWLAWLFAGYVIALCLALVHGEDLPASSVSMHYNRWAWALAYVAVPLAMIEPLGRRRPWLDGGLIGLMMAGMALVKVTYFIAFAPGVVVALLVRRDLSALAVALAVGLAVAGICTLALGVEFWAAYLRDLMSVAQSETRAAPGDSFFGVMGSPGRIGGTMLLLATVIFLRQSEAMAEGLVLLLLTPAFIYVTYQNFGNDPQWLVLAALIALALRPQTSVANGFGWRLRDAMTLVGAGALALASGSALNLVWSPLRQAFAETENTVPYLSMRPQDSDLFVRSPRVYKAMQQIAADGPGGPYEAYRAKGDGKEVPKPTVLNGETLPECELQMGFNAWFETAAADLETAGYGGSSVLVADLFSALWLYGPFKPVKGGAPWYYGGAPGIEAADHVLVPLCPTGLSRRTEIVKAIADAGWRLSEERRTATYILLRPEKP